MMSHLLARVRHRVMPPVVGCAVGRPAAHAAGASVSLLRLPAARPGAYARMQSGLSEDQAARVRKVMQSVQGNVKEGVDALRSLYGGDELAPKKWMVDFYLHAEHKFIVPAATELLNDEESMGMPTLASKTAIFVAHALRALPAEAVGSVVSSLPFVLQDQRLLLAILRLAGLPQTRELFERLAIRIRQSGDREMLEAGQHVGAIPLQPVHTWAIPFEAAAPASAKDGTPEGRLRSDWQRLVQPYEVAPIWRNVKDAVDFTEYLLLASSTHLECQWSAFYATGDKRCVRRVIDVASHWAEFARSLPDHVSLITDIQAPLPEELTKAAATDHAGQVRMVRAQMARAACYTLLSHAARHARVAEALAESFASLAPHFLDSTAFKPAVSPSGGAGDGSDAAAAGEAPAAADTYVEDNRPEAIQRRLEMVPELTHLLAAWAAANRAATAPSS